MTLQQMRYFLEVVRLGCNITRAAQALSIAQPSLSRQMQSLEREIGVDLFVRENKRLIGLSEPGEQVHRIALRMVLDAERARSVGAEFRQEHTGMLTIATTHTQARYALPAVVRAFSARYPNIALRLRQGTPTEAAQMVVDGTADLSIATAPPDPHPDLVFLPCYTLPRIILTPVGHPLMRYRPLTLKRLAGFPLITYDYSFSTHSKILETFARENLAPSVIINAIDADVIKTYVELGMGVAIVPSLAFDRQRDKGLRARDASMLFQPSTIQIGLRRDGYLRSYTASFIELFAPHLEKSILPRALLDPQSIPMPGTLRAFKPLPKR
ncbi:CysB family HTH-type transcriptional regulator [Pigmentiphaga soli]|uniref:CysB family HTH-type transcriptional regulator n=1 Tax=Pigmentiphaga soli TaxID=1007095 RepID=A0ABP8GD07_9BURK